MPFVSRCLALLGGRARLMASPHPKVPATLIIWGSPLSTSSIWRAQEQLQAPADDLETDEWSPPPKLEQPYRAGRTPDRTLSPTEALQRRLENLVADRRHDEAKACFEEYLSEAAEAVQQGTFQASIRPSTSLWSTYVFALSKLKTGAMQLRMVPRRMHQMQVKPTLRIYNAILKACMVNISPSSSRLAADMLAEMQMQGVSPNINSFLWVLETSTRPNAVHLPTITQVMEELTRHERLDLEDVDPFHLRRVLSRTIKLLIRTRPEQACSFLLRLHERGFPLPSHLLQEGVRGAERADDVGLALRFVSILTMLPLPEGQLEARVDEGAMLTLLNMAARHASLELATRAWVLLQCSLAPPAHLPPSKYSAIRGRFECADEVALRQASIPSYHALIHARAAAGDLRGAFLAVGQMEEAHGSNNMALAFHAGLRMLTDACASSIEQIDAAYFALEDIRAKGERVSPAMANCVLAACSQAGDLPRTFETFEALATLGLEPDIDSYNAVLVGCVRHDLLESVPRICTEIVEKGLAYNEATMRILVEYHIVGRNPDSLLQVITDMDAAQMQVGMGLLEAGLARCEREGHAQGVDLLGDRIGHINWRSYVAYHKMKRWSPLGGTAFLADSPNFLPRRPPDRMQQQFQAAHQDGLQWKV